MVDHNKLSVTELLEMDNKSLVSIIVSLQGQVSEISGQLGLLIEQLAVANQRTFGRKSEKPLTRISLVSLIWILTSLMKQKLILITPGNLTLPK